MAISDESYPSTKTPKPKGDSKSIGQLTLKEAWGALSLHGLWVIVATLSTALLGLSTAGYVFGTHVAEARAHESMAALQTGNVVKSAELEKLKAEQVILSSANQMLKEQIGQKDIQVAQLVAATDRGKNCDYLRKKISAVEQALEEQQYPMVQHFDKTASVQRDKETIDRLESRLKEYVEKFSTCTTAGA